jgi:hypothetical protein
MNTIRWDQDGANPFEDVTVNLDVVPGTEYKLQLMFQDDTGNRGCDVFFEGVLAVDQFKSGTGTLTSGTLITDTFTAGDNLLTIQLDGTGTGFTDTNARACLLPRRGRRAVWLQAPSRGAAAAMSFADFAGSPRSEGKSRESKARL